MIGGNREISTMFRMIGALGLLGSLVCPLAGDSTLPPPRPLLGPPTPPVLNCDASDEFTPSEQWQGIQSVARLKNRGKDSSCVGSAVIISVQPSDDKKGFRIIL